MKILFAHPYLEGEDPGAAWVEVWLARLRKASIDVHPFRLGLDFPGRRLPWRELDRRWRRGDRSLMKLYETLARSVAGHDVFVNSVGNLHPEFLAQLPTVNVWNFCDDPESSQDFSKPFATAYDLCMIGNIAEVDTYKSWGVKNVQWWPLGFMDDDFDPRLTEQEILTQTRDVDVTLLCERLNRWRRKRVDRFAIAFPNGFYRGRGWPDGFLPETQRVPLLQRTKVGVNFHNSTGPINQRTFYLPANGALQICDNKSNLANVFMVDQEVVGFDSVEEAIDLCSYYLLHDDERRKIAAAGWKRAVRDYNEVAVFRRLIAAVEGLKTNSKPHVDGRRLSILIAKHVDETRLRRTGEALMRPVTWPWLQIKRYAVGAARRIILLRDNLALRLARFSK